MSLRARLLAAIGLALLLSLVAGGILALRDAARTVSLEVGSALVTASQGVAAQATRVAHDWDALRQLVASFDGSRHVVVTLTDAAGHDLAASNPALPQHPAPRWFARLVTPALPAMSLPATPYGLYITPFPASEIGERWTEAQYRVLLLGMLSLLTGALCFATAAHGMRPLQILQDGFLRMANGERRFRIPPSGPPEIAALTNGFNRMAAALAETEALNGRLNTQLLRLAEEERLEIARDLHDEIGPSLFAITTFAATAGRLIDNGAPAAVPAQLQAIHSAVAALQSGVRDMLGRLRETKSADVDLLGALDKLVRFWRSIRPETEFSLSVSGDVAMIAENASNVLYRVAQEAVSNAVRHGLPAHVDVKLGVAEGGIVLSVHDDGSGDETPGGFGLLGMQERVMEAGGTLTFLKDAGWVVTALVPAA
jgi:two-component system sensor histidine kinase UhpB